MAEKTTTASPTSLTASTTAGPAAKVATVPADPNMLDPENVFGQLIALTDGDVVNIRNKFRALSGSEQVISFFGSVSSASSLTLVSTKIPFRFAIQEIEATFESASDDLQVSFLVSADGNAANTGRNILADYSPNPYFVGNTITISAKPNPTEFKDGQYLKVYGLNSSSGASINLNARIRIKVYPLIPQSS